MVGWATGKHALVTGGGTGIGAATARMLGEAGASVSLVGRRREPLEAVAAETGGKAYPADMTDRAAMEAAFSARPVPIGSSPGAAAPSLTCERWT